MDDDSIDCATFLRLTDTRLGEHGLHVISVVGVRAALPLEEIESSPDTPAKQAMLLDFVNRARLDLPATPARLVEWVELQHHDFQLPEWFVATVRAEPSIAVEQVLFRRQQVQHELEALVPSPNLSAIDRYILNTKAGKLEAELMLLERAYSKLRTGQPGQAPKKRQNRDAMNSEIEDVLAQLGNDGGPGAVMTELKKRAGKPASCVTESIPEGVMWRRLGGEPEKLNSKLLSARLSRRNARSRTEGKK